jgi:transcriptional regulator with XRE-family HTH domain
VDFLTGHFCSFPAKESGQEILPVNQTNMAASLNIKRPTLVGYENGLSPPSVDFLIKLRAVYKVNIDWLLTGNGKKFL